MNLCSKFSELGEDLSKDRIMKEFFKDPLILTEIIIIGIIIIGFFFIIFILYLRKDY